MELKYRIDELLNELPRKDYAPTISRIIDRVGKTRSHFNRIRKIPVGSTSSITTDDLLIIADELNCKVDDLLNTKVLA